MPASTKSLSFTIPNADEFVKAIAKEVCAQLSNKTDSKTELQKIEDKKKIAANITDNLSRLYDDLGQADKSSRISECASFLWFRKYINQEQRTTETHLHKANFCKHPLCPVCAWRAHLKNSKVINRATRSVMRNPNTDIYHLILTIPNIPAGQMTANKLKELRAGAVSFLRRKRGYNDYYLATEITWSHKTGWHPHFHILVSAPADLIIDYDFIRRLRAEWGVHMNSPFGWYMAAMYRATDPESAAWELTKYICKPPKDRKMPLARLSEIAMATKGMRRYSSGGKYKAATAAAKKEVAAEEKQRIETMESWKEYEDSFYSWVSGQYKECSKVKGGVAVHLDP